jgi:hypothetical protein
VLALALALNLAVWSNDDEESGVKWYTTAELLKALGIEAT